MKVTQIQQYYESLLSRVFKTNGPVDSISIYNKPKSFTTCLWLRSVFNTRNYQRPSGHFLEPYNNIKSEQSPPSKKHTYFLEALLKHISLDRE